MFIHDAHLHKLVIHTFKGTRYIYVELVITRIFLLLERVSNGFMYGSISNVYRYMRKLTLLNTFSTSVLLKLPGFVWMTLDRTHY